MTEPKWKCTACGRPEDDCSAAPCDAVVLDRLGVTPLEDLIEEAWTTAEEKGWHTKSRTFGDDIALIHSELSEALEAFREGRGFLSWTDLSGTPHGVPIELADCLIRIFDMCKTRGIDLEGALQKKMAYNKGRPYRHGGKKL